MRGFGSEWCRVGLRRGVFPFVGVGGRWGLDVVLVPPPRLLLKVLAVLVLSCAGRVEGSGRGRVFVKGSLGVTRLGSLISLGESFEVIVRFRIGFVECDRSLPRTWGLFWELCCVFEV